MNTRRNINSIILTALMLIAFTGIRAQGTMADYDKAKNLGKLISDKVMHGGVRPEWIGKTNKFWYSTLTEKGTEYFLVDAATAKKSAAFDAEKLAAQLSAQSAKPVKPYEASFRNVKFSDDLKTLTFNTEGFEWTYDLKKKNLTKGKVVSMDRRDPPATGAKAGMNWLINRWYRLIACGMSLYGISMFGSNRIKEGMQFNKARTAYPDSTIRPSIYTGRPIRKNWLL